MIILLILTVPKNAIIKQYVRLFKMENIELEFRENALIAIAKKAKERKTGARGLRTILENVLLDSMYDLPSIPDVIKVVIDESVINGDSKPYLIYKKNSVEKKVASD